MLIFTIVYVWYKNRACLLNIFQYQPITLRYTWLSVEQPIGFPLIDVYASSGISNKWEDNSNVNMPDYSVNSK